MEERTGGTEGNARLTGTTGVVLLPLLAVEGVTILFLRSLLSLHVFVGMLLIPPVALKLASTGWRFARYYTGNHTYRLKGPPRLLLRVLVAPAVVLSTIALLGTGVALIILGPRNGTLVGLHQASFVVCFIAIGVHVLAYIFELPGLALGDWRASTHIPSRAARLALVVASLAVGAALAAATVHLAGPWTDWLRTRHH